MEPPLEPSSSHQQIVEKTLSDPDIASKKTQKVKYYLFTIFTIAVFTSLIVLSYHFYSFIRGNGKTAQLPDTQTLVPSPTDKPVNIKISLLKSTNLSTVTIGTAINSIPIEKAELDAGVASYSFKFYGTKLSAEQHQQFLNHIYPYNEFPVEISVFENSPVWLASSSSDAEFILAKKGFLCQTPFDYGPILCADDESGSCLYPPYLGVRCAYVVHPKDNTLDKVSSFISDSLREAGVVCSNSNCLVEELSEEAISVSQYSRRIIYFEDLPTLEDPKYTDIAKNDIQSSSSAFQAAGWKTKTEDLTEAARGSNPGVFASIRVTASNDKFECTHTIDTSNQWGAEEPGVTKKRQIINCMVHPAVVKAIGIQSVL
jgi:hypothetical protein